MERSKTVILVLLVLLAAAVVTGATGTVWDTDTDWNQGSFTNTTATSGNLSLRLDPQRSAVAASAYCGISFSQPDDEWISNVHVEDAQGNVLLDNPNTRDNSDGYQDFTSNLIEANPGETLTITVSVDATKGWTRSLSWGGDMPNAGTLTPIANLTAQGAAFSHTYTYTVPQQTGNYIASWWVHARGYDAPCGSHDYGEREDYTLSVSEYPSTGSHTTEWRDTGTNASWFRLNYSTKIPGNTGINATVQSSTDGSTVADQAQIQLNTGTDGTQITGLNTGRYVRIVTGLGTSDRTRTPQVDLYNVSYKDIGISAARATNDTEEHTFYTNATITHPEGDTAVQSCTLYVKDSNDLTSFQKTTNLVNGVAPDLNNGTADNVAWCNGTVSNDIPQIGPNEKVQFYVQFTDVDGITTTTAIAANTVPNRAPQINGTRHVEHPDAHAFDFSSAGFDIDEGSSEITGCTIFAEDPDGNRKSLGTLDTTFKGADDAACNATISSSLSNFAVNEDIEVWSRFTDVAGAQATSARQVFTIPDHPPKIDSGPTISNYTDRHAFNVSAVASDPDGDADWSGGTAGCRVYLDDRDGNTHTASGSLNDGYGNPNQSSCNFSRVDTSFSGFEVREIIDVTVEFSDAYGGTVNSSIGSHRIPNHPPDTLSPAEIKHFVGDVDHVTNHTPLVNWTNPNDPDGDALTVRLYTGNTKTPGTIDRSVAIGTAFGQEENATIGNDVNLLDGTEYNVLVEACDAWTCTRLPASSNTKFTMNAEPSINTVQLNKSAGSLVNGDTVRLESDVTDANGDAISSATYTVRNETDSDIILNQDPATNAGDEWWNSTGWKVKTNKVYSWEFNASDGFETSTRTGSFTVGSDPPVINGTTLTDYPDAHAFNVSALVFDLNEDLNRYTITVDDGDGNVCSTSDTINKTYGGAKEGAVNYSRIDTSFCSGFEVGETLIVELTINDSAGSTDTTSQLKEIPNKPPTLSSVAVTPTAPDTNDVLDVSYTVSDPEGDAVPDRLYRWYVNTTGKTDITTRTVDPDDTTEYENWTVEVEVQDEYGASSGDVNGTSQWLRNAPPVIRSGPTVTNASDAHAFDVVATAGDIDGQSDISSCSLNYGNGTGKHTRAGTVDTDYGNVTDVRCTFTVAADNESWLEPEETLNLNVSFSDEKGPVTTPDAANTIPNRVPDIALDFPANDTDTSNGTVTFRWTGSDVEGDTLNYTLTIGDGTSIIRSLGSSNTSRDVGLPGGDLAWNVSVTDAYGTTTYLSTNTSETRNLLVDTTPPSNTVAPNVTVTSSGHWPPWSNDTVRCSSRWSDAVALGDARVFENATGTNHSVAYSSGWANHTITGAEMVPGHVRCTTVAFDHLDNADAAYVGFDVVDIVPPNITDFVSAPTTEHDLDPGRTVTVNATVTDDLALDTVLLEYQVDGGAWQRGNLNDTGSGYWGNFTPVTAGSYTFRIRANDTAGNNASVNGTAEVAYEYNWTRDRSDVGDRSSTLETNQITFGTVDVTNAGDKPMNITVGQEGDANLNLSFSTDELSLAAGASGSVTVNGSLVSNTTDDEGTYFFNVTFDANRTEADPQQLKSRGSGRFFLDGPFIALYRGGEFPLSVDQGESGVLLPVIVSSEGTAPANDTWVKYDIPDGWSTDDALNVTVGDIPDGTAKDANITVDIPSDASIGTQQVNLTAGAINRSGFTASFAVDVIEVTEDGGDEGGGTIITDGGGAPTGDLTGEEEAQLFQTEEVFELVRGRDGSFTLTFTNPTAYNLTGMSVTAEGLLSQYIGLEPSFIGNITVNETRTVEVRIEAPEFFEPGRHELVFTLEGKGIQPLRFGDVNRFNVTVERRVTLIIHEISRRNATVFLSRLEQLRESLERRNLSDREVADLLDRANESLQDRDYTGVQDAFDEAQAIHDAAVQAQDLLAELDRQMADAERRGLDVTRTRRVASLAEVAMERGDYRTALQRAEEAQNLYALETKGEVNYLNLIMRNLGLFLFLVAAGIVTGIGGFYRLQVRMLRDEIERVDRESEDIQDQIRELQVKTFREKERSLEDYEESLEYYQEELGENLREKINLETRLTYLLTFNEMERLQEEKGEVKDLVERTQRKYWEEDEITSEVYEQRMEMLQERKADLLTQIADLRVERIVNEQKRFGNLRNRINEFNPGWKGG